MTPGAADAAARRVGLVLALVGTLIAVDTTVALVALPTIATDLGTTLPRGIWITTAYVLGLVVVIPLADWLSARFGDRRVYLTGLAVFVAASAAVAAAPGIESVVAARFVQGLGGGVLNPIGMAIALRSVPDDHRGRVMSYLGLSILIGPVFGPPLAGWLVDVTSWRWLFWINVPLGALAFGLCRWILPAGAPSEDRRPLDLIGLVLVTGGCLALVSALTLAGESGGLGLTTTGAALVGLVLLGCFARHALRARHPLVRVSLLREPRLGAGAVVLGCFAAAYFGSGSILPTFVQGVRGDPVAVAGTLELPIGIAVGVTLQVATRLVDRVDPRRVIAVGTATALVGMIALAGALTVDAPYAVIGAVSLLVGIGSGATLMPTTVAATAALTGADVSAGTTLLNLVQQLGFAVGTALVASTTTLLVTARVPDLPPVGDGGALAAMVALDPDRRAELAADLAAAVGPAYLVPAVLVLVAFATALVAMPRRDARAVRSRRTPRGARR